MFSHARGALTDSFTGAGGTGNGATIAATPHRGVALLMAVVLDTGRAARVCR
jgi:ribose 5-phosphate isomerase RpiB